MYATRMFSLSLKPQGEGPWVENKRLVMFAKPFPRERGFNLTKTTDIIEMWAVTLLLDRRDLGSQTSTNRLHNFTNTPISACTMCPVSIFAQTVGMHIYTLTIYANTHTNCLILTKFQGSVLGLI